MLPLIVDIEFVLPVEFAVLPLPTKPFVFVVLLAGVGFAVLLLFVDDTLLLAALFVELLLLALPAGFSVLVAFALPVVLFDMLNSLKNRSLFLFIVLVPIRLAVRLFLPDDGEAPFEPFS